MSLRKGIGFCQQSVLDKKSSFFLCINPNGEKKFNLYDVDTCCTAKIRINKA